MEYKVLSIRGGVIRSAHRAVFAFVPAARPHSGPRKLSRFSPNWPSVTGSWPLACRPQHDPGCGITIVACGYVGTAPARHWHQARPALAAGATTSADRPKSWPPWPFGSGADAADPIGLTPSPCMGKVRPPCFCLAPSGERQVDADG